MRPGPARGETASMTVVVTPAMTARIGDREIHPLYGTRALVEHVEEVCRRLLEPHLEPGEEGVGYRMEVVHRAPAPVGTELQVTATVADVTSRRLLCEFAVRNGTRQVAMGSFEQRVVAGEEFAASYERREPV